ncbi:MAG: phosphatidylglycerophosphatase A, partial [Candidatus Electrothrix sp. AR1]|nr:phosphatidylglycerophosphatase A [Candidatus Electrothrix sp. AR1]
VVIDEILGQLIALALVPWHPLAALAGFALFRFFDILKPFPVGWLDQHIHGGLGIMLDDVMAGIYALLLLQGLIWLVGS